MAVLVVMFVMMVVVLLLSVLVRHVPYHPLLREIVFANRLLLLMISI